MSQTEKQAVRRSHQKTAIAAVAIFLLAFGVRFFTMQDTRIEALRVQSGVASGYQHAADLLRQTGIKGFFDPSGPLANPNFLGHPPGYPVVRALVATVFGDSHTTIQYFQIICDALAAVLVLIIAIRLLPFAVGVIAGVLVAFAPQFAWNSVLLLPDTLSVLPLLLTAYFLVSAAQKPRVVKLILAGVFVGLSCWLRANALLLAPFLALSTVFLFQRGQRLRFALALLAGAVIVIAPLTIRNWIVHHHFVPVSLGAGQTMLEGIADYDPARRFGIPDTDMGIMKMEAEEQNRPDYYSTLFDPDGVKRERMRLRRAASVVANNPFWFAGVMIRRAGSMLRLERARLVSDRPPVSNDYSSLDENRRVWTKTPAEFVASGLEKAAGVQIEPATDGKSLGVVSDTSRYGVQFKTAPIPTKKNTEYALQLPAVVKEGRMTVDVVSEAGEVLASAVIESAEVKSGEQQPLVVSTLPFVSTTESVRLVFSNAAPQSGTSIVELGEVALFDLGPASSGWGRYPRLLVRTLQKPFITAVMLPLSLLGIFILARRRAGQTLVLLLSIPAYYLCVQSALHTEYRYVMVIHYFLFIAVAVSLNEIWLLGWRLVLRRTKQ